jgi:hypothetical protein
VVTAPSFPATELQAFAGRGKGDYLGSHDLEDIIAVLDGRPGILDEMKAANADVRTFVADNFRALLRESSFLDALPGHVTDPGREPVVWARLEELAALGSG